MSSVKFTILTIGIQVPKFLCLPMGMERKCLTA